MENIKWMYVETTEGAAILPKAYHVYNQPDPDQMYETICFVQDEKHARLISAAPEMLLEIEFLSERLTAMVEYQGGNSTEDVYITRAVALIKKIKGE